jgi:hypothetical protein
MISTLEVQINSLLVKKTLPMAIQERSEGGVLGVEGEAL